MKFSARVYASNQDQLLMLDLARQSFDQHLHVIDLPYRFSSWAFDEPENARLWFDQSGQLAAWAVFQTPFWAVDYVCPPAWEGALQPEILAWIEQRAAAIQNTAFERPVWYLNVFSGQTPRVRSLESAGFECQSEVGKDSWSKVLLRRPGSAPVETALLAPGFTIRPLAGQEEVQNYVALHQTVFESKNMTAAWRARTLQHPAYRPDLDIVIEAPDGQLAAFCIGWYDAALQAGQIEPLGSHSSYRGLGLGRAALSEVLRRLHALGANAIFVETDRQRNPALRLYESIGFEVIQEVLVYKKDFAK
jgi:ribosomal protein S18 acetylase RimI-like enzyme